MQLQHNVKQQGNARTHQIDVYWEFKKAGIPFRVVVECKDYKSPVKAEKIEAFKTTLEDLNNPIGTFVTRNGYQEGALQVAKHYGIQLMVIHGPDNGECRKYDKTRESIGGITIQNNIFLWKVRGNKIYPINDGIIYGIIKGDSRFLESFFYFMGGFKMMTRRKSFYEKYIKRTIDIVLALIILILFCWLFLIVAVLVRLKLGAPILFTQQRPGMIESKNGREKIFKLYKFRTMTDAKDKDGKLLSDEERLTKFGLILRHSSLDEIPEIFNILKGDMSFIGPRPQLVRDMVFMSDEQRMRHTAKPGLSGLAQVMGRNAISWEEKFKWDLKYIENISFLTDLKIVLMTVMKVFGNKESDEELDVTLDFGDHLLQEGKVTKEEYDRLQKVAVEMLKEV